MAYTLSTIWFERNRFFPAVLAVAFSALLITVQGGLMIGLLAMMSVPVDRCEADIWVAYPGTQSVDLGIPIPERWQNRIAADPDIAYTESYIIGFSLWTRTTEAGKPPIAAVCTVIGSKLDHDSLGAVQSLRDQPKLLAALSEPFTVVVDESELGRLGIRGVGEKAEVIGRRVRVVGTVKGYRSLAGPYVFCSLETARELVRANSDQVMYFLGKCKPGVDPKTSKAKLGRYSQMSAFTKEEFSTRTRIHWLTTTKAGVAIGFTALLGLFVGAVVTSQTLFAATIASQREYATMRAMGIPRWRLQLTVLSQAFWVGLLGILIALPVTLILSKVANSFGTEIILHPYVLITAGVVTLVMALVSGLAALRSFQGVDPAHNIR
ncbi:MAG: ABC transporter permease [Gemmataceae bacterium]